MSDEVLRRPTAGGRSSATARGRGCDTGERTIGPGNVRQGLLGPFKSFGVFLISFVSIEIMVQAGAAIPDPNPKAWHHESVDT